MLVVNHEGIRAGTKTFGSTEFVLSWEEIEAIYIGISAFCIRPISMKQVLSRYGALKRIMLRVTFPRDILVTQTYLAKPVSDIFEQVQENYAYELEHYHIQLHP